MVMSRTIEALEVRLAVLTVENVVGAPGWGAETRSLGLMVGRSSTEFVISINNTIAASQSLTRPLLPNANATHPPMRQTPPSGVTGPMNLNLCGSRTRQ